MAPTQKWKALSPLVPGRPKTLKGGENMEAIIGLIAEIAGNIVEKAVHDKLTEMDDDE